jgi:hypothetical protein
MKVNSNPMQALGHKNPKTKPVPFETELIDFLRKSFNPSFSDNLNTSRTDVLIESMVARSGAILDLCSGWPLLLEKMVNKHAKRRSDGQPCSSQIKYVACDTIVSNEAFKEKWGKLEAKIKELGCGCIQAHPCLADTSDSHRLSHNLKAYHNEKFDHILISNALHEHDPLCLPHLLHVVVSELLVSGGSIVLIDPKPDWLLAPERWDECEKLSEIPIDWEAKAIWLPPNAYEKIISILGCTTEGADEAEKSQEFWYMPATKHLEPDEKDRIVCEIKTILKEVLSMQAKAEIGRIAKYRLDLASSLSNGHNINSRRLTLDALRFFCSCASQARRFEIVSGLGGI